MSRGIHGLHFDGWQLGSGGLRTIDVMDVEMKIKKTLKNVKNVEKIKKKRL